MPIRARALAICSALFAVMFLASATGLSAQDKKDQKNQQKISKEQLQEARELVELVDATLAGKQPMPTEVPLQFQYHFMRSREGKTFIPYTLAIDPPPTAPSFLLYVRAVKKGEAPAAPAAEAKSDKKVAVEYPWEEPYFIDTKANPPAAGQPYRVSRYLGLNGGEYDVYIALRERTVGASEKEKKQDKNAPAPKTTILKQSINAPDFNSTAALSSIIVVEKVEDLTTPMNDEQLKSNPYTFGTMKLTPALSNKFSKKGEISWIFVIYNAQLDATTKRPDVTVEYSFHQKTKDGEKYFNKTSPQKFDAQTLPPQWDGTTSNQLSAGQSVPLASFPEGDYRLEVKVTDKLGNKTLTENVPFTVVAGS